MKERDLQIDRSCHVVYSKPCKKQIQEKNCKALSAERAGRNLGKSAATVCGFS